MPTSEMKPVPPGRIWWSAVGACVWGPTTRLARPSTKCPIVCFSLVASPWMSITTASAIRPSGKAASSVLAIDDDEVELPIGDQAGQPVEHDRPPAAADDVADEKDAHRL